MTDPSGSGTSSSAMQDPVPSPSPLLGKTRLKRSAVHDHFDQVDVHHPATKKIVNGSQCKECKQTFANRVATNLKNHLQAKHPEAYDDVLRK